MSGMYRFPEDTPLAAGAFRASGWQDAIAEADRDGYFSLHSRLSGAARAAMDRGDHAIAKALWIVADACSMMLQPESISDPFRPSFILEGRRSSVPEDFDEESLQFFAEILSEIDDHWLRARLADLLWLCRVPRQVEYAQIAIDAYRSTPVNLGTWASGGKECWIRAIGLCRMLRDGAADRLDKICTSLLSIFNKTSIADGYLPLWIAQTLREQRLHRDAAIPDKLQELAASFGDIGEIHRSRDFFDEASQWYAWCGDERRAAAMSVAVAESYVKEAHARTSSDTPVYMWAASLMESAIQSFRRVPRALRAEFGIDTRIADAHTRMNEYGERSLGEMGRIETNPIDLSEMIEAARAEVRGKSPAEALLALSRVSSGASFQRDQEFAQKAIREHPLSGLFASSYMSTNGRVIAKTPASGLGNPDSEEFRSAVRARMIRHYAMGIEIAVKGAIWPGLEVVAAEHRLRVLDFVSLARSSPIVPIDREELVGKALFFGFDGDFAASTHLLVPQIEHLVRAHIKEAGRKTTTLSQEGIEQEKGFSSLMKDPVAEKVFGEDLAFEIEALFCDPLGPNLRNEIAHGLVDDRASQSFYACYAWWFGLRLVFLAFWNAARQGGQNSREEPAEESPDTEHGPRGARGGDLSDPH